MNKKTVLITGASRGIGQASAELFCSKGWNVVLNYRSSDNKAILLEKKLNTIYPNSVIAVKADVGDRQQVDNMLNITLDRFGTINALINNAGIAGTKVFSDISKAEWDEMIGVNLTGVFNCTQAVLPGMIHQKSGKIVNVSSIWGLVGASCEVHYSAAKAGVIGLTKALAKELGPSNIQVNCVCPGIIQTDMIGSLSPEDLEDLKQETPLMRLGTPVDVANCLYFLTSPEADFFTGQVLSPNGGFVI